MGEVGEGFQGPRGREESWGRVPGTKGPGGELGEFFLIFFIAFIYTGNYTIWPVASFRCIPVVIIIICYAHDLQPS